MSIILYGIGTLVIIVSLITGFKTGEFYYFLVQGFLGFLSAMIFFALGKIIDNQEKIKYYLTTVNKVHRKRPLSIEELKTCSRCNKQYDMYQSSCPYCGNK